MAERGERIYYEGRAWRPARHDTEDVDGWFVITDINRFGVQMTLSGWEGTPGNEQDYTITWKQYEERPRAPRSGGKK